MATVRMGIRQLRDDLTAAVRGVRAGETIEVTHDGAPVALLTPIPQGERDRLIAEGILKPARGPLVLPEPRPSRTGPTAEGILEEIREDRF